MLQKGGQKSKLDIKQKEYQRKNNFHGTLFVRILWIGLLLL